MVTEIGGTPRRLYLIPLEDTAISLGGSLYGMVVCYLIQTSDGRNILIDTGIPADYQPPAGAPPHTHERNVVNQLAALGLRPDDIDLLVCTHFDVDHAGFHDAFASAELVVQREHYELARSGYARFAPARPHWDHPALRYRLIEGDIELLPGVTLLETSGHCAGHQSVLVRLPQTGPVLLAGDAVALERLFTPERKAWPLDDDEERLRTSTRKLLDLVERERVALVVFGHDAAQWQILKAAPDYYE
ncbi:MAG TPA: N-acyl homoserine lactonase family protein [Ktedonobacterales bacterium]|nr:N-acyl homoserine lactonase family protein [Ktedonobacterales bacterium]